MAWLHIWRHSMRLLGWTGSSVGGTCGLARLTTGQVCFNSPCKGLEVSHFVQTSLLLFGQIISAVAVMTQRYLLAALPKLVLLSQHPWLLLQTAATRAIIFFIAAAAAIGLDDASNQVSLWIKSNLQPTCALEKLSSVLDIIPRLPPCTH